MLGLRLGIPTAQMSRKLRLSLDIAPTPWALHLPRQHAYLYHVYCKATVDSLDCS
jgi:hypothetical protein